MQVEEFLKQDNIQSLLYHEDMDELFFEWARTSNANYRPLVKFFEMNDINALDYMSVIPNGYFYFNPTKNIIIPEGIKVIASNAIYRCRNLIEIHIPKSVEDIFKHAICGCEQLNKITYEGTAKEFKQIADDNFCTEAVSIICNDETIEYEYWDE